MQRHRAFGFAARIITPALVSLLAVACGSDGKGNKSPPADGSVVVGSAGGTVTLSGGPTLTIPAGALSADTTITIKQSANTPPQGVTTLYQFGPEGTTFAVPVTVSFPVPSGTSAAVVLWSRPGSSTDYDRLATTFDGTTATAQVTHFSEGGPVTTACEVSVDLWLISVSGKVSGAVSEGVTVAVTDGFGPTHVKTDSAGNYTLPAVLCGDVSGCYGHEVDAPAVAPLLSGYWFTPSRAWPCSANRSVVEADFTAMPTHSISGRVLGVDDPTEVTMTLSGASGTKTTAPDSSGNYTFGDLADDTYTITPAAPGLAFHPESASVKVSGADAQAPDFTGSALAFAITGNVTGAVSSGVTVTMTGQGLSGSTSVVTGSPGGYSFEGVAGYTYTVTPSLSQYTFRPAAITVTVRNHDVRLPDFTSSLASDSTYSISGKVTGAGASAVTVTLDGAASTTVDPSTGNYAFHGLANGSYTVTPSASGLAFTPAGASVAVNGGDAVAPDCAAATASASWTTVSSDTTADLYAVSGSAPDDVWAVGAATIVHLGSAGTWQSVSCPVNTWLSGVWAHASDDAWAVGASGTILHWNGLGWASAQSPTTHWLNAVWGNNGGEAWAVGAGGTILHYDPAGGTWTEVTNTATADLYGLWGGSGSPPSAYVGLGGTILDYDLNSNASGTARDLFAVGAGDNGDWGMWAVGAGGTIVYSPVSWTPTASGTTRDLYGAWGQTYQVWAVGARGTVLYGTASTISSPPYFVTDWSSEPTDTTKNLYGVWGGWAVGEGGTILQRQ